MNFDIAYQILLPALQKIAELAHSYGWAIIVLTVAFRLMVWPLVAQTTISMRRMTKLQPQMKALQERYKGNPEQLQKKLMEFYSKNKINPMGGCLPTLIQLPLLFALYATFAGPPFTDKTIDVKVNVVPAGQTQSISRAEVSGANSIYVSKDGVSAKVVVFPGNSTVVAGSDLTFGTRAAEGRLNPDFVPEWKLIPPNKNDDKGKALDGQIAQIDANGHAVFPAPGEYHVQAIIPGIAKDESFAFVSGLGKVATGTKLLNPSNFDLVVLILLFGASMFLSQKLTVPTPQVNKDQELDEQQIIQQQTMKTMPIVTTAMFFFFPIPAGVYLYLVISNIIQTFQTWLISRMPEPALADVSDDGPVIDISAKDVSRNNGREGKNISDTKGSTTEKKKSKRKKN